MSEGDEAAQRFTYEGYDIISLQKLVERDYTIPEPQTAEEVISYFAKRIANDVKLPSQFAALVPKVREFLETKAFGKEVGLASPAMIRAISTPIAQYVTVKAFSQALRGLVVEELSPTLLSAGRRLSWKASPRHARSRSSQPLVVDRQDDLTQPQMAWKQRRRLKLTRIGRAHDRGHQPRTPGRRREPTTEFLVT